MTAIAAPAVALHAQAAAVFDATVRQIRSDQWRLPTPCAGWDVRALVDHVVTEARWTPPLLSGQAVSEVGDDLSGDLLGDDPLATWSTGYHGAIAATDRPGLEQQIVHLSFGDTPAAEYLHQLAADYLIHSWDLAVAIGADDQLDAELVSVVARWFASRAAAYRDVGVVAAPVRVAETDDPQHRLLAAFGRDPQRCASAAAVARFAAAFDRHDVDAIMAAMTDDCVFESTAPPDGTRHQGQRAVRAVWTEFFDASGDAAFETEEHIVCGDRVVTRWHYTWTGGHVRGVDIYRVRDGRVAEKLSYVKG